MEEPSDGLHEKQKYGRRYGRKYTYLAFGSGWTALGCIDHIYIYFIGIKYIHGVFSKKIIKSNCYVIYHKNKTKKAIYHYVGLNLIFEHTGIKNYCCIR